MVQVMQTEIVMADYPDALDHYFPANLTEIWLDDNSTNVSAVLVNGTESETDIDLVVLRWMTIKAVMVPVVFALIFVAGCLGNGTLIHVFVRHKELRTTPNIYIVALSVGDLCVVLFCIPFVATIYTFQSWPYGLIMCKIGEFVTQASTGMSVFTLTALSVDRYVAITHPMRAHVGNNPRRLTYCVVAGIVVLALLCALPFLLFAEVVPKGHDGILVCHPYPEHFGPGYGQGMVVYKALLYYAVPLTLITVFYISMARRLVQSAASMPGEARARRQINSRKNVAKMVLGFVFFFAVCFLPNHVFFLWFYFDPNAEQVYNIFWDILRILGFTLSFTNSCVNPVVMYCVSSTFRKMFNR
ncbi:unnamed protein product [Notodromas monacha]|uniref:G-protein coupled receptors family 1 profile domain-containing protein n=1 Tax=Notodromas monacha TaxID=399045 RepID=A0A7R9BWP8_9CRUS|nr:unnamed protein product [Notodromas monacha]CAG0922206.1 unnamed protein product [Notodromas monacha]